MELPLIPDLPILVVGDIILDHYYYGEVERISPESPVPIVRQQKDQYVLGGAANVARNLVDLGAKVSLLGCIGKDEPGRILKKELNKSGIDSGMLLVDPSRPTTLKTRVVSHGQQMLRLDRENIEPVNKKVLKNLKKKLSQKKFIYKLLIISDYLKGFLIPETLDYILRYAKKWKLPVVVDPKGSNFKKYQGADWITPNRKEALTASNISEDSNKPLDEIARILCKQTSGKGVLITLGPDGMYLSYRKGNKWFSDQVSTQAREVYDVTGAGDTAAAVFGYAIASGQEPEDSARLANYAAGIVVGKSGAATITRDELYHAAHGYAQSSLKLKKLPELAEIFSILKNDKKKIVFTNGCFDLLHVGHIKFLQQARRHGDCLVVGLNSDVSVKKLKGEGRPLIPEQERADIISTLDCVDYVIIYSDPSPIRLLKKLKPDILIKGTNYSEAQIAGRKVVEGYGGKVIRLPFFFESSENKITISIK
jgi:D-beta-D-heptose 7-phosphate kinase/D-beta-D-heptose 1-phosphate adenosyltransferase